MKYFLKASMNRSENVFGGGGSAGEPSEFIPGMPS
jgi:hypothetical protein